MKLTNFEKLALIMLCDVVEKIEVKGGVNPNLVREAIYSGNTWALEWEYPGIFASDHNEETVTDVCDILDMWDLIERAGGEKFPGFDGNRESEHASVASFLTEQMDRFETFKGRTGHGVVGLEGYRRMYQKFEPIRADLVNRREVALTNKEVAELLAERVHPDNR